MSKSRKELAAEIICSLHSELQEQYRQKHFDDSKYSKEFGEYIGDQYKYILSALMSE